MRFVFTIMLLLSLHEVYACEYDPLLRLGKCLDNSDLYFGRAVPDDEGDFSEDPWFAKKILNDAKCEQLKGHIKAEKGKDVSCSYVKEEMKNICNLVEPKGKEEEDD